MNTYICLLRGINVSGLKPIKMSDLVTDFEEIGFTNVVTYLQSGNVVFDTSERDLAKILHIIETKIIKSFGFVVSALIRNKGEWYRVFTENPFLNQRKEDAEKLYVTFLSTEPADSEIKSLKGPAGITDEFILSGKEIYLFCPDGYGRTKLSNAYFEKKLKVTATTRNWRTVSALEEIAR
jgi:uncharacterized protein (DUF1697 family)